MRETTSGRVLLATRSLVVAAAISVLFCTISSPNSAATTDPASETPTDASIQVFFDWACLRAEPVGDEIRYNWTASGRMAGNPVYGAFTIVWEYSNGTKDINRWWYSAEKSGLVGVAHIVFHGKGVNDWSSWILAFWHQREPYSESLESITLWVRGFKDMNGTLWNQASKVMYTAGGGFVCEETRDDASLLLISAGLVTGVIAGVAAIVVTKRRRSARGTDSQVETDSGE